MHAPAVSHDVETRPLSTADSLARAVLAGFTASLTMLLTFLVAYNLARLLSAAPIPTWPGLERTSIIHPASWIADGSQAGTAAGQAGFLAAMLETVRPWLVNLAHNRLIDAGLNDVYLAAGIYVLGGVLWAMLYTVVEPHLRGSPWLRGVTFAMIPALVSLVVVLPLLGAGPFGIALGAGPLPTIGNILLHAVYGAILGVIYGPMGDLDASTLERPTDTRTGAGSFERLAAVLLVGGLLVGGLAGLAASTAGGTNAILAGEAGGGLIISGALLGAAIGLFVGSFLSLSPRHR
jgi:hypothetical protein